MWSRIKRILSITAVRLSVVYMMIFGVLALIIIFYMTGATVSILVREVRTSIDGEMKQIESVYNRGGLNRLIRVLEVKARSPDANIYVIADDKGEILAGNVFSIDERVMTKPGWTRHPFHYYRFSDQDHADEGGEREHASLAYGRIMALDDKLFILVGRDVSGREKFSQVVRKVLLLTLAAMFMLALFTWLFVGRRALKRLELISKSADRIMAGDREERLPVTGTKDEFDTLSSRLNAMLDRIFKLDEGLKHVSDNIAHDLRTPITRLRNRIEEGLATNEDSEAFRDTLEQALADCDGVIRTFDALLMISRLESGSAVASMAPQNMSEIASEVSELYEPVAEEEGFAFHVEACEGITLNGNRELLGQAISNLINNALKYGKGAKEPEIFISVKQDGAKIIVAVADNGSGIPESDHEEVFKRFSRLEKSRNQPGNGLGLSLVKAIAELHGGEVRLGDNKPGLRVEMVLPSGQGQTKLAK